MLRQPAERVFPVCDAEIMQDREHTGGCDLEDSTTPVVTARIRAALDRGAIEIAVGAFDQGTRRDGAVNAVEVVKLAEFRLERLFVRNPLGKFLELGFTQEGHILQVAPVLG